MKITTESQVTLHFELALADGEIVDSNFDTRPATFIMGDENLPASFEHCLLGLEPGATERFEIAPEDAFGLHREDNIQSFRRHQFGADYPLEPGVVVSFADAAGAELPGVVLSLDGDYVRVDFNHPLAGKTLHFRVQIIDVQPAPTSAA